VDERERAKDSHLSNWEKEVVMSFSQKGKAERGGGVGWRD
jgi:hypothetical protein